MKKPTGIFLALVILMAASNVCHAASPYATCAGAGWFNVVYQVKDAWEWDEDQQQVVNTGTVIHIDETVIQGPDQDWSTPGDIHPGVINYDSFVGPSDKFTSGWGGAASGGSLILCFDTPFVDGEGPDILVDGFGYGFNMPFSAEMGTVDVYVADASYNPTITDADLHTGLVTITGDETKWVKVSGWERTANPDPGNQAYGYGDVWVSGNPDFNYRSFPGGYCDLFLCDLADAGISSASYIKFELGNGGMYWSEPKDDWDTTGRAIFVDSVKTLYHRPIAQAGADQNVNVGIEVTLDGSRSVDIDEGDEVTYQWEQTAGSQVALSGTTDAKATFTADTIGLRTFRLTVNDGAFSSEDTIDIQVDPEGTPQSPKADAGPDQKVNTGDIVMLDASGSWDPDGGDLSYSWVQTAGPDIILSDAESARPAFTAPYTGLTLAFKVTVSDGELSDWDTVDIEVNRPPIADAGRTEEEATEFLLFTLDASRSLDPDGDDLSYQWIQTAGPAVVLSDSTAKKATFMTPELPGESLSFQLTVSDEDGLSDTDTVEIRIRKLYVIDTPIYATYATNATGAMSWRTGELDVAKQALGAPDYAAGGDCSGWDSIQGNMTLKFFMPLADGDGEDLRIYYFGSGRTEVSLSVDGETWISIGALPAAPDGGDLLFYASYDLADYPDLGGGSHVLSVQYLKIEKTETEGQVFIDAVQGRHCALTTIHAKSVEGVDGSVDWVNKAADGGENALGEPDYDDSTAGIGNCSGWMVNAGYITLGFDRPMLDREGDDLYIYHFGQGVTDADIINGYTEGATTIEVSEDGNTWISLGDLPLGVNRGTDLSRDSFDFSDFPELGECDESDEFRDVRIQYVRINKNGTGYTAGKFIDAVEGKYGFPGAANPAGKDRIVEEGSALVLGVPDDDAGNTVYEWVQVDNDAPGVVLSADNVPSPTFVAPSVDNQEVTLTFELMKTNQDEFGVSLNSVNITVLENGVTQFPDADYTVYNEVAGRNMGISCETGDLVFHEVGDPDYKYSEHYISDMNKRPKNLEYGMIYFDVLVPAEGDTCVVTFHLPEAAPSDYRWYKYSEEKGWCDFTRQGDGDGAVFSADRTKVTLYITDNGDYDDDERPGFISDPSGMGIPGVWHDGDSGGGGCFIGTCAGE
jgi:hypothetical protein